MKKYRHYYNKLDGKIFYYDGIIEGYTNYAIYGPIYDYEIGRTIKKYTGDEYEGYNVAEGKEIVVLEKVKVVYLESTNMEYSSIQEALSYCSKTSKDKIILYDDLSITQNSGLLEIEESIDLVIDLNGKKLYLMDENALVNKGELTFEDSSSEKDGEINLLGQNTFKTEGILNVKDEIIINGESHMITAKRKEYSSGTLLIDGKEITSAIDNDRFEDMMNGYLSAIGVIQIEEKPFIVVRWWEGSIAGDHLYSINNNLELKYEKSFEELYKVGNRYIEPNFFVECDADHYRDGIVIGYSYYEDGEWKYINRSINGKVLVNDEGFLSDELYIEGKGFYVSSGMFWEGFSTYKNESVALLTASKFTIKRVYPDSPLVYDIEMLEDSIWGYVDKNEASEHPEKFDENGDWTGNIQNEEHIQAGTLVEKVQK